MYMKIGFIGQGWIGRHYADDFEARGYDVVRYALEEPYRQNQALVGTCDIVFIAVPTPTTPEGFSYAPVADALQHVAPGAVAVIKSTLLPGTTEKLQAIFPDRFVFHSPEFLVEKTAAYDAANPKRNIVGIPQVTPEAEAKATAVLSVLPNAPYAAIMPAREAEIVKYAGNCFLYTKVLFMNLLHDYVTAHGASFATVKEAVLEDERIGRSHMEPVHDSGRGAGGHCFIKDFEAWRRDYAELLNDTAGQAVLDALVQKNLELLVQTEKDLDLLEGVYGKRV